MALPNCYRGVCSRAMPLGLCDSNPCALDGEDCVGTWLSGGSLAPLRGNQRASQDGPQ